MMTKEESLELAKKCEATDYTDYGALTPTGICFDTLDKFLAYTSAIEEKYQAQIAMLRERDKYYGAPCEYFDDHTKTWIPARFIALAFSKVDREPLIQAERRMPIFGTWNSVRGLDEKGIKAAYALFEQSLSATQATADAFIAEVKARAFIEAAQECREWKSAAKTLRSNNDRASREFAYETVARSLEAMAAELRDQQPEQPRKPCTCDGWCDGLCLEKEGKRK